MLRLVAIVVILLAGGLGYEIATGDQIGISAAMRGIATSVTDMAGGIGG